MKVLQIINSLGTGGAEKLLVDSIPLYRKAGVEMDLLVFWDDDLPFLKELEKQHCCKIYVLSKSSNFRSIYNPMHILRMRRIMQQYDIAHVHLFPAQYYAVFANKLNSLLNKSKIPLVFTEHNTSNQRRHSVYRTIDQFIYSGYNVIGCISPATKNNLEKHLVRVKSEIAVINNGINISLFAPKKHRKDFDFFNRNSFVLVQTSSFREQKDQPTLIRSLTFLPPEVKLMFIGDGHLRSDNENLAKSLGVQDRILFLGIRNDVPDLLQYADVCVLSSKYEGFGLAIVEGMAAGKPAVASDVEGLREIVNGYGLLFPQGDAKALAAQIIKLYEDKGFYRQIAEQCYNRAKDFDINTMVHQYMTVYKSISLE